MLKGVFLDLSGVLYEGQTPLPGAVDAVRRLQSSDLVLRFVTNSARKNRHQLLDDLSAMGFALRPEQLFSAPLATADWIRRHHLHPYLLVHPNILADFHGIDAVTGVHEGAPDTDIHGAARRVRAVRENLTATNVAVNAVVIGDAGDAIHYENLDAAFQLLMAGAELIAIGDNRYFKGDDGLHLDVGPFVRALEHAASKQALIIGKPSTPFFQMVLHDAQLSAENVMMFGDDIYGDIQGALAAGMQACLVRSGKYRADDENKIEGRFEIYDSLQRWLEEAGVNPAA
ncbi:MAG: HAD-IIA family hydrolase [Gammaproteobacteria bacterium]|nr:HAD-IIA family hydrolase [Gammaproteobacteria bacterium]MBQ0773840.1 HAD-IIA family hydrolase [Gammaproteobacteria bacterium]